MSSEQAVEKIEATENQKVKISIIPRFCKGCEICVITSYSIHYTKLYELLLNLRLRKSSNAVA